MRILVVLTLPWQRWIVARLVEAMAGDGHEVDVLTHHPKGSHDWLGNATVSAYAGPRPEVVILPDMPFAPIRYRWPDVPLLSIRHSLASRGNTWDPDHRHADGVATWSSWDEKEWARRGQPIDPIRSGPVWVASTTEAVRRAASEPAPSPEAFPDRLEPVVDGAGEEPPGFRALPESRPRLLWAPSFTHKWSARELVLDGLRVLRDQLGWRVRIRPHAAVAWREGDGFVGACDNALGAGGWERSDGSTDPAPDIAESDVLVSDVSGISLLALAKPSMGQVLVTTSEAREGHGHPGQHDAQGPEWRYRSEIARLVDPTRMPADSEWPPPLGLARIFAAARIDGLDRRRAQFGELIMGPDVEGAPRRLSAAIPEWAERVRHARG